MSVGIAYVDGPRMRRSLLAAADWVAAGRDELNRLNVYPVPDGDTGTNLCLTLRAVTVDTFDRLVRSGRVSRGNAWLGTKLNLKPIMVLSAKSKIELVARYHPRQCLLSPITPVIAAHAGIGAWGVFYQNEDGTNA